MAKWVKIDQIIKDYKKDYPKEWQSFVKEMNKFRKQKQSGKFRISAKFPAYPDETDISCRIIKIIPDLIINDRKWFKFKKLYPEFFVR